VVADLLHPLLTAVALLLLPSPIAVAQHLHLFLIADAAQRRSLARLACSASCTAVDVVRLLLQFLTVAAMLQSYLAVADLKLLNVVATAVPVANYLCLIVYAEIVFHVLAKA